MSSQRKGSTLPSAKRAGGRAGGQAAHACRSAPAAPHRASNFSCCSSDLSCTPPSRLRAPVWAPPSASRIVRFVGACAAPAAPRAMQGRRNAPQVVRQGHGHYLPPAQLHGSLPGHQAQQHHAQYEQQHPHGHPHHAHHHPPAVAAPPPGAARHLTTTTFASLPLSPASQRALAEVLRFTHLTEVQNATLPAVSWAGVVCGVQVAGALACRPAAPVSALPGHRGDGCALPCPVRRAAGRAPAI